MRIYNFIGFALLALLAACGPPQPQYRTDFDLITPSSETGRMCANNCLLAQQNCQQSCNIQKQNCRQTAALERQNARLLADRAYDDYVEQRTREGKLIKKDRDDFLYYGSDYSSDSCYEEACKQQCTSSFHICYGNCGGQVIPRTYCVYNCHLVNQTPPTSNYQPPPVNQGF